MRVSQENSGLRTVFFSRRRAFANQFDTFEKTFAEQSTNCNANREGHESSLDVHFYHQHRFQTNVGVDGTEARHSWPGRHRHKVGGKEIWNQYPIKTNQTRISHAEGKFDADCAGADVVCQPEILCQQFTVNSFSHQDVGTRNPKPVCSLSKVITGSPAVRFLFVRTLTHWGVNLFRE